MKTYHKKNFPVENIRRFLEPGPVVLVSSFHKGETDIMTMGWHMVMEFEPSRIGCFITDANHSFGLIRKSRECVINIPTSDMAATIADIGNCHGGKIDKFKKFSLTASPAGKVKAPLIAECFAHIECRLEDSSLIDKYGLFIFEAVKAHAPARPKYPKTLHYTGGGVFMISGRHINLAQRFKKKNL